MLVYYVHINLYILFFWLFFHLILRKEHYFQTSRYYLLGSVFISILIPFLHNNSQAVSFIYKEIPFQLNISDYIKTSFTSTAANVNDTPVTDYVTILRYIPALGSLIMLWAVLYKHAKISMLLKNATSCEYAGLKIRKTAKSVIPFLYYRSIVVPGSMPTDEMDIVIKHEYRHYKLGHYVDNFLFQVFQIVFWMNPFIYLLRKDLKQVHEYQVDREMIKSGIDASLYKLTLIKFSVGYQKFAVANGLTDYKLKKRLVMMNYIPVKKWKWKFLLFIPAFYVVFSLLSFTTSRNNFASDTTKREVIENQEKPFIIKIIPVTIEDLSNLNRNNSVIVMMNKRSQLLLDGKEKCSLNEIGDKVSNLFQQKIAHDYRQLNKDVLGNITSKQMLVIQKSNKTNMNDYNNLIVRLSGSLHSLLEMYSEKFFDKSYELLNSAEKEKIDNLIQPEIYKLPDKNI